MQKVNFMKAKNSFLGRALRRLAGEEKGAVMMEYIVIGLLIAALAVVAVAMFGRTATDMFGVLSTAMTGDHREAQAQQDKAQANLVAAQEAAREHANNAHSQKSGADIGSDSW